MVLRHLSELVLLISRLSYLVLSKGPRRLSFTFETQNPVLGTLSKQSIFGFSILAGCVQESQSLNIHFVLYLCRENLHSPKRMATRRTSQIVCHIRT